MLDETKTPSIHLKSCMISGLSGLCLYGVNSPTRNLFNGLSWITLKWFLCRIIKMMPTYPNQEYLKLIFKIATSIRSCRCSTFRFRFTADHSNNTRVSRYYNFSYIPIIAICIFVRSSFDLTFNI